MPLRNLNTVPPGGWRLDQMLPDGRVKKWHTMNPIWPFAEEIADFRKGNGLPNATAKEVVHEIEEATCLRLHDDPSWCVSAQKKTQPAASRPFANVVRAAAGGRILVEWLGTGAKPVPTDIAQSRANICMTCPENQKGSKWLKLTADTVKAIAEQMQAKDYMKLRVEDESKLHSCRICLCPLRLKVHVPIGTILNHTDQETLNSFPPNCWIPKELPKPL